MRKATRFLITAMTALVLACFGAMPANAGWDWGNEWGKQVPTATVVATDGVEPFAEEGTPSQWCTDPVYPNYTYQTGNCFWSDELCLASGDTSIAASYLAQRMNIYGGMKINYRNNCVTAGYPPSRRMTVTSYYAEDGKCGKYTNQTVDSLGRWTNNPVIWLNYAYSCGGGSGNAWQHRASAYITQVLGIKLTNTTGFSNYVTNMTAWSYVNIPYMNGYSTHLMCLTSIYGLDGCP